MLLLPYLHLRVFCIKITFTIQPHIDRLTSSNNNCLFAVQNALKKTPLPIQLNTMLHILKTV